MSAPQRPRLLVLTSTLPRWRDDSEPRFVLDLTRALSDRFEPLILAPMAVGAARREQLEGIAVERFSYTPVAAWQRLAAPGAIMPNLRKNRLLYLLVPALIVAQFVAAARLLRRERFDLIHCHWLVPQGLVLALLSLFIKLPPMLLTCHGADAFMFNAGPLALLKRWVLRRAAAVTVVSREIAATLSRFTDKPLVHIPMGVDLDHFAMRDPIQTRAPVILFAGRLAAKKGVDQLLRVLANPRLLDCGARVRIIGDGPLREELEALASTLGVAERVGFLGAMPHARLIEEMKAAALFCAPFVIDRDGDREGTPTVLLEAAACGMPIVTSDIGGCGDIVVHGRSGWLLPPGDEAALAVALIEALAAPDLARAMGEGARQQALEHGWPTTAGQYAEVLLSMKSVWPAQLGEEERACAA